MSLLEIFPYIMAAIAAALLISIKISSPKVRPSTTTKPTPTPEVPVEAESPVQAQPDDVPYDMKLEQIPSGTFQANTKGDPSKVAILFGINQCDPGVYQGDRLTLKGCVNDSRAVLSLLLKKGFGKIWYNEDKDCSISNFLRVWKSATKDLKDGDTLVLQMSRHGMALGMNVIESDVEGGTGEYSGDQAAVMYDGLIVDDCFWRLFMDLPKVKLIFINDSCHSGSQYKVASITLPGQEKNYRKARSVGKEYMPKKNNVLDTAQLEREFGKPKNTERKFDLISISGCQDNETSSDAFLGGKYAGAMTYCLLSTLYKNPRKSLTAIGKDLALLLKQQGFAQNPKITVEGDQSLLNKPLF
jgi:hypothetical protein